MATRSMVGGVGGTIKNDAKIGVGRQTIKGPESGYWKSIKDWTQRNIVEPYNKWGETDPEGRFNAISGIANYFEGEQARQDQLGMEAVNSLAQPYTGRNAKLIAPASISNTIYGYNLAERKRKNDERLSSIYTNLLKEYTKAVKAKTK